MKAHWWERVELMRQWSEGNNTIFIIMGNFHDFGKIQFRWSRPKMYPLGTF